MVTSGVLCPDGGLDMKKLESVLDRDEFTYSVKDRECPGVAQAYE